MGANLAPIANVRRAAGPRRMPPAKLSLGWVSYPAAVLSTLDPRAAALIGDASPASRQYLAMALAALDGRSHLAPSLEELAGRIASEPRRGLLQELWGGDLGAPQLLGKLGRRILSAPSYTQIATILLDPRRRMIFAGLTTRITSHTLRRILETPDNVLDVFRPSLIANVGGPALHYLLRGLSALRPDLAQADLINRINRSAGRGRALASLINRVVAGAAAPEPPWEGNSSIVPLRTLIELKQTAYEFRNCLDDQAIVIRLHLGDVAYYLCKTSAPCIVELTRHRLLRFWRLGAIKGYKNKAVTAAAIREIESAFIKQGIFRLTFKDIYASGLSFYEE